MLSEEQFSAKPGQKSPLVLHLLLTRKWIDGG
jgi:hypothetical protein